MGHRRCTIARLRFVLALIAVFACVTTACAATPQLTVVQADATSELPADLRQTRSEERVGVDLSLTRADVDCSQRAINRYPDVPVLSAHVVVDGVLGAPCFGEVDERLIKAWTLLLAITPREELRSMAIFAGFVSNESGRTTLAYVNPLDASALDFQMAVNVIEADLDPTELRLTVAHEFAHVLTTRSGEFDPRVRPHDCRTWHNRRGCFAEGSLIDRWVEEFWGNGLIDGLDPKAEPSLESGSARCATQSGFFGPYGASHPEEDFAEAFSAFVFQVAPTTEGQRERLAWFAARPELLRFRNQAIESGLGAPNYQFSPCG